MAEPFATAAAGIALIGNLHGLYNYLKEMKKGMGTVHDDIDALQTELETLRDLCESVEQLQDSYHKQPSLTAEQKKQWDGLSGPLETMEVAIHDFSVKLRKVYGEDPKQRARIESFKKWRRFKDLEPEVNALRAIISNSRENILVWMQSIGINKLESTYQDIMAKLAQLEKANEAAKALPRAAKKNKHFAIPKAVESHYLGREVELVTLAQAFWSKDQVQHQQKRHVIYGVGGSGKTQFCGKYAQEFRESYWGVFWIDGATADRLKNSLTSNVAEKGGVGKNHEAALHWLSNQDEDWLLIIDNADDPDLDLLEFFPQGANGHVLITTRNQDCTFGNIGSTGFYGMEETEANELFLKVADITESTENQKDVSEILHELGYLALAIVVAGSAIHQGYCKLKSYLGYLERVWKGRRSRRVVPGSDDSQEKEREGRVEAQFDLSLDAIKKREIKAIQRRDKEGEMAARDAPELLRTFAFMHREKMSYRFLELCAENGIKEQAVEEAETGDISPASQSWGQYLFEKLLWICNAPSRHPSSTILPNILRQARHAGKLDEDRLRRAMQFLRSYSLVTYDKDTDSWSMHRLIQRWAREGYESNPGEHHVWCNAAATLVSSCIILTDNSDGSEALMRELLPHVIEVRERQRALSTRILDNQYGRNKWYPVLDWGPKPHLLLMYAKFSKVYVSVGRYAEANELQRVVHRALETLRGYESSKTRRMTIFWARTLWSLGYADEQAKLLEKLVDNCQRIFGPDHPETHVASVKLADARLQQGRVRDARALCDVSVPGLEKHRGPEDEETLDALNIHAMAILLTGKPDAVKEAKRLYRRTWMTRERLLDKNHVSTLNSRQLFYATSFWDGSEAGHREAEQGMEEIIGLMKEKLGKEHPLTLLSMLYQARVKVELRDFDGAQKLFDYGLPKAERHLEKDHMAILFCRYHIGRMYVRQGRWLDARGILVEVAASQSIALQGWGRFHYDRIGSLLELARVHHELGEDDECDAVVKEAFEGFQRITGSVHPWAEKLRSDYEGWKRQRASLLRSRRQPLVRLAS